MKSCFVCQSEITKRNTEMHHFPLSKLNNGTTTIPLCRICHDFVDRHPLIDWPFDMYERGLNGFNREARLMMLKMVKNVNSMFRNGGDLYSNLIHESPLLSQEAAVVGQSHKPSNMGTDNTLSASGL